MFGNGLRISDGDFHRRQRSLIQPASPYADRSLCVTHDEHSRGEERFLADGQRLAVDKEMASPDVEQRLHAEVDQVLAGRPAEYCDLPYLVYTKCAALKPPHGTQGWALSRFTTTESRDWRLPHAGRRFNLLQPACAEPQPRHSLRP